ncbi:MAG: alpha/beta hydrolase, partial [Chloroflexi bacterium]|nr:alpha/beta hydrolase [Chloroflexota bacterium]
MPLYPEVKASLEKQAALGLPAQHEVSPEEARAMSEGQPRIPGPEVASVSDLAAPGPHGDVPVRVYVPVTDDTAPLPVCVWFHGGGWVVGSITTNDPTCRALADASGAIVVSVDYRLAPEHKFPIPLDDCYAATEWAVANAASFGGDPSRLAVAGSSAGGNLAAAVALRARDEGGPRLAHQSLICPVVDSDFTRPSYLENGDGYGLNYDTMVYFFQC